MRRPASAGISAPSIPEKQPRSTNERSNTSSTRGELWQRTVRRPRKKSRRRCTSASTERGRAASQVRKSRAGNRQSPSACQRPAQKETRCRTRDLRRKGPRSLRRSDRRRSLLRRRNKKGRARVAPGPDQSSCSLGNGADVLVDHSRDRLFARRTNHALDFLSVAEEDQRRNTFDPVALCGRRVVVHIQLHHARGVAILLCHRSYGRSQHAARGTPLRPKINQHRFAGTQNILLKRAIAHFIHKFTHFSRS